MIEVQKNKKGELTTQQIVILIVAITSFIILVFLFGRLNFGKESQTELCRNSVLMEGGSVVSEANVLNCHTKYLCITQDGSCEGLTNPDVEKVKNLEEVYEILADEMADCWWMFGEGKVDYVGKDVTKNNYCSICSQIVFDDSLSELEDVEQTISKDKLYDSLSQKEFSNKKITYAEYLFGTKDLNALRTMAYDESGVGNFGKIQVGKQYFIIMGITSKTNNWRWLAIGGAVVGGVASFLIDPLPFIAGVLVVGTAGAGGGLLADAQDAEIAGISVPGDGISNQFMAPTIIEANSDKFNALNCEKIVTFS